MLRNNVKFFLPVFRKLYANNYNKVMINSLIKSKLLLNQFQKEEIFMRWVLLNIVTLEIGNHVHSSYVSKFLQGKSFNL